MKAWSCTKQFKGHLLSVANVAMHPTKPILVCARIIVPVRMHPRGFFKLYARVANVVIHQIMPLLMYVSVLRLCLCLCTFVCHL